MAKIKIRALIAGLTIITISFLGASISYGKYVLEDNLVAAKLNIDRTKPVGEVDYETKEATKDSALVTVNLSEPIKEVEGWTLSQDKLTMTKIYEQNTIENITIEDLAGNENTVEITIQNIDKEKPEISLVKIHNSNEGYEGYASKIHTITATIKITDSSLKSDIDISKIDVFVGEDFNTCKKEIQNLVQTDTEITFDLILTEVQGNGELKLSIPEGFVIDNVGNESEEQIYNLNIIIDNIAPQII